MTFEYVDGGYLPCDLFDNWGLQSFIVDDSRGWNRDYISVEEGIDNGGIIFNSDLGGRCLNVSKVADCDFFRNWGL